MKDPTGLKIYKFAGGILEIQVECDNLWQSSAGNWCWAVFGRGALALALGHKCKTAAAAHQEARKAALSVLRKAVEKETARKVEALNREPPA